MVGCEGEGLMIEIWLLWQTCEYNDRWAKVVSLHIQEKHAIEAMERLMFEWDVEQPWEKRNRHLWETRDGQYTVSLDQRITE